MLNLQIQSGIYENILDSDDIKRLGALLDSSRNIILTCHMRPDGDAVGSTLGLWNLLRSMGKNVNVVVPDRVPRSLLSSRECAKSRSLPSMTLTASGLYRKLTAS